MGIASENRIVISQFLRSYRDTNHDIPQTLITGAFVGGEFSQSRLYSTPSAIEHHARIDRSQTQHEHLQLFMNSLKSDPSNSLSYEKSLNKERK